MNNQGNSNVICCQDPSAVAMNIFTKLQAIHPIVAETFRYEQKMPNTRWRQMKCQEMTEAIRIHPLRTTNVYTNFSWQFI